METALGKNSFIDSVINSLESAKDENNRLGEKRLMDVAFSRIAAKDSTFVERSAALMTACCLVSKITLQQLCSRVKRAFFRKSKKQKSNDRQKMPMAQKRRPKKKRGRPKKSALENRLKNLYYDLNNSTAYAGAHLLKKAAKNEGHDPKKVLERLKAQKTYTLHKPVRWHFPRRMYNVRNVGDYWEVDLADLKNLKDYNDGYRYILICIDLLSKYAFAEALQDKQHARWLQLLKK